jgi:hypothetical protein
VSGAGAGPQGFRVALALPSGRRLVAEVRESAPATVGAAPPAQLVLGGGDPEVLPVHLRLAVTDRGLEAFGEAGQRFSIGGMRRLRAPLHDGDVLVIGSTPIQVSVAAIEPAPATSPPPAPAPSPAPAPAPAPSPAPAPALSSDPAAASARRAPSPTPAPAPPPPAAPDAPAIAASLASALARPSGTFTPPPHSPAPPSPATLSPATPAPPPPTPRPAVASPRAPAPAAAAAPSDGWSDDLVALLAGRAPRTAAAPAPRRRPGLGGKRKARRDDPSGDPLSLLMGGGRGARGAGAAAPAPSSGAPPEAPRAGLLTPEALPAPGGPDALLGAVPGAWLASLLVLLEARGASGELRARAGGEDGAALEGRLILRDGALAVPLIGDPLAPIVAWLSPLSRLPRVEVHVRLVPPPPVEVEAALRVGALLDELARAHGGA